MKLIGIRKVIFNFKSRQGCICVSGEAYFKKWTNEIVSVRFNTNDNARQVYKRYQTNKTKSILGWPEDLGYYHWTKEPKNLKPNSSEMGELLKTLVWMETFPDEPKTSWTHPQYEAMLEKFLNPSKNPSPPSVGPFR